MAVRRRSGFRRSGSRPNRGWSATLESTVTSVGASNKVILASFANNVAADLTILRVVGGVAVASDQSAAVEVQQGAVGMMIVTDIAFAAGAASVPGPVTDAADDGWFVHQFFGQQSSLVATMPNSVWYPIDQKAKRIVDSTGQVIVLMGENINASNGLTLFFQIRILTQLRGTA